MLMLYERIIVVMNKQPACAATAVIFYDALLLLNAPEHLFRSVG